MLRSICSALSRAPLNILKNNVRTIQAAIPAIKSNQFSTLNIINSGKLQTNVMSPNMPTLMKPLDHQMLQTIVPQLQLTPCRTVTKFSLRLGKRKTVGHVIQRFYRLHWGAWIRTIAGRHKKIWKKSSNQRRRIRQHVFCNATQSRMLDKMVTKYWRKPKYYVDDPYEPYHTREEFDLTRRKPLYTPRDA